MGNTPLDDGIAGAGPGTLPGAVSTDTGTIIARSESSAPGVLVIDSDSRRPDATGS